MAYLRFFQYSFFPLLKRKIAEVRGIEHVPISPPYIIAANHPASFDGPMIAAVIKQHRKEMTYFITAPAFWQIWGRDRALKWLGMIPFDHKNKDESIRMAVDFLRKGRVVAIFPEGQRNPSEALLKGKTGALRLAMQSGAPVIPCGIINKMGLTFWRSLFRLFTPGTTTRIRFGPPVDLSAFKGQEMTYELLQKGTTVIMKEIAILANKSYRGTT